MSSTPLQLYIVTISFIRKEGGNYKIVGGVYTDLELVKIALEELATSEIDSATPLEFTVHTQPLNPKKMAVNTESCVLSGFFSSGFGDKVHYNTHAKQEKVEEPNKATENKNNKKKRAHIAEPLTQEEKQKLLNEMWHQEIDGCFSVCMVCPHCGGSSTGTCSCAERKFKNRISDAEIKAFRDKKKDRQKVNFVNGPAITTPPTFDSPWNSNTTQPKSRYGCAFQGCQGCVECYPKSGNSSKYFNYKA
jgi:hypothetical protein